MRLLHATRLEFREFFDADVPSYAILSHRWGDSSQEVSYADFLAGKKRDTAGYRKIISFCRMTRESAKLEWCWVDTCCIDKTSSAELSEAVNSMYGWYENAAICYAYLQDLPDVPDNMLEDRLADCQWFYRGWTLQELIAPTSVVFCNQLWKQIGTERSLQDTIFQITGISRELLAERYHLDRHSAAEKMSWASNRTTSRIEDQAYCLLGLFGINMPLMYGERENAFRRLQEAIVAKTNDHSLFAWAQAEEKVGAVSVARARSSILAPSPRAFAGCNDINRGFPSNRLVFDLTNRGVMLQVHRSYDPKILELLVQMCRTNLDSIESFATGLTVPLACFRYPPGCDCGFADPHRKMETFFLLLILDGHKWRYVGVTKLSVRDVFYEHVGKPTYAYDNDYIRLEIHHDEETRPSLWIEEGLSRITYGRAIRWIHLRDTESMKDGEVLRTETDVRTVPYGRGESAAFGRSLRDVPPDMFYKSSQTGYIKRARTES